MGGPQSRAAGGVEEEEISRLWSDELSGSHAAEDSPLLLERGCSPVFSEASGGLGTGCASRYAFSAA